VYSFNVANFDSSFVSDYLNEKFNICTRSGLHCAPLVHKKLKTQDKGAVRVSISSDNTFDDIFKKFKLGKLVLLGFSSLDTYPFVLPLSYSMSPIL